MAVFSIGVDGGLKASERRARAPEVRVEAGRRRPDDRPLRARLVGPARGSRGAAGRVGPGAAPPGAGGPGRRGDARRRREPRRPLRGDRLVRRREWAASSIVDGAASRVTQVSALGRRRGSSSPSAWIAETCRASPSGSARSSRSPRSPSYPSRRRDALRLEGPLTEEVRERLPEDLVALSLEDFTKSFLPPRALLRLLDGVTCSVRRGFRLLGVVPALRDVGLEELRREAAGPAVAARLLAEPVRGGGVTRDVWTWAGLDALWERFLPETPFGRDGEGPARALHRPGRAGGVLRPDGRGARPPRGARRRPRDARPDPASPEAPPPLPGGTAGGVRRGRGLPAQEVPLQPPEPPRAPARRAEGAVLPWRRFPAVSTSCSERDGRETSRSTSPTPTTPSSPPSAARSARTTPRRAACARRTSGRFASAGASRSRGARFSSSRGSGSTTLPPRRDLLDVEPWDAARLCVRPRPAPRRSASPRRTSALLSRERGLEARVLAALSVPLREGAARLPRAGPGGGVVRPRARRGAPRARGRARLARSSTTARSGSSAAGTFPTEALCESLDTPYAPLDATFDGGPTVLFGSNMGGKTVVLKTLAFLQLAAQAGLFVPAARFATRVFRRFHYVGEGRSREEGRGLSGFGFEIRQFNEAHADFGDETLALFDEFARTTSSGEAEALLSAILEELVGAPARRRPLLHPLPRRAAPSRRPLPADGRARPVAPRPGGPTARTTRTSPPASAASTG